MHEQDGEERERDAIDEELDREGVGESGLILQVRIGVHEQTELVHGRFGRVVHWHRAREGGDWSFTCGAWCFAVEESVKRVQVCLGGPKAQGSG
jgi:hypothetical protein